MATEIICRASDCIFWENKLCTSEKIVYDPDEGCLTYEILDDLIGVDDDDADEDNEWDDDELVADDDWDDDDDDADEDDDLFLDDDLDDDNW